MNEDCFNNQEKIDISEKKSIKYWSEKLCCNESDLIEAVKIIGNKASVVDDFLFLNRKKIK